MSRVREAIRSSMAGMTEQQRAYVAERVGKSVSTLYQCGEPGMKCHLTAEEVATFCGATGSDAVLQAITMDTHEQMDAARNRGQLTLPGTVTEWDLAREANDIPASVFTAFRDSIVTPREIRSIWIEVQQFVSALLRFGATRRKATPPRARTLAEAERL